MNAVIVIALGLTAGILAIVTGKPFSVIAWPFIAAIWAFLYLTK